MKSLTLVLCVVALLGSAASTFLYFKIGDTKSKFQRQLSQQKEVASEIQDELANSTAQVDALKKQIALMDSDLADAKSKLASTDNKKIDLARNVDQLTNQIIAKDDALKTLNDEIAGLRRDLATAKLASASPDEVENYKQTIATLQTKVAELEAAKHATVVVTNADGTTTIKPAPNTPEDGLNGQVVSIGAKNGFVVINIGAAKGVQVNQTFNITRGTAAIATAKVSSVVQDFSIAQVMSESFRGSLRKGDVATLVGAQ